MKTWIKIALVLALIVIVAGIYMYCEFNRGPIDYAKAEPELVVKAKRLYTDFAQNQQLANEKYVGSEGKMIQIEGNISKVELVDSLVVLVYVYEYGDFGDEGIRVTMLPEFNSKAKTLSSIREVKLKGLCTGYNETDVIIEKASLLE